ncbi:MAG TPA: 30S ribosomal protein S9 [Nitrospirae bacterium]|nr:30S ribosomal protein S9 [bacterium BMS3Bbin09]HDH34058.1 30S ribosomal protein S9 [Nitrospirota bacterium]HDO67522.1 30S ribosomal protein S9 [Nitrospirota bacterium]HEW81696.1 30S ribosomal protein S9 [Nitrospirota bacterium]
MADIQYNATGRRKTSIAQVFMTPGKGNITINKKPLDQYFPYETMKMIVQQPLNLVAVMGKYDINIRVKGGGFSGQANAIRHGISRALLVVNSDFRGQLKKEGLLTRDPRAVERKKYGQKGARARFQFSKR